MQKPKKKNQEFKNFTNGIVYFLCIALALFVVTIAFLNFSPDAPRFVDFERWSSITDAINLVIGLPIAFAGAYVAISIAGRAADISEKQQSQQDHIYYEQLHEQLIDNYFQITQSANQLVSAANRFEETFYSLLNRETSSKYSVINFIDDDHRRSYIQEMLVQNRNGIADVLNDIRDDIKQHIFHLIEAIDEAFKYSSVNETWNLSTSDPKHVSLLTEAQKMNLFIGDLHLSHKGQDWMMAAKSEILERLDLHQVSHAIRSDQQKTHPLLPFCLYLTELNDFSAHHPLAKGNQYLEVLLAGYFLMTHVSLSEQDERIFLNSGALFLVDLIHSLPTSEHIKLAFSKRFLETEASYTGQDIETKGDNLFDSANDAYGKLDKNNQRLFSLLAQNIQFSHYSPRIRQTRTLIQEVLNNHTSGDEIPLLRIKYELLKTVQAEK